MTLTQNDKQAKLATAYGELVKRGDTVTVRTLRTEAGVATADASAWLRANRATEATPPVPVDELAGTVAALWSVAVSTARDELRIEWGVRETQLVDAEARALEDVAVERAAKDDMQEQFTRLQADSAREISRLTNELAAAIQTAATERITAREAEQRASRAEATAETLQRVVDQNFPPTTKK